jgi:hypothetical protein
MCEVSILLPSNKNAGGVVRGFDVMYQVSCDFRECFMVRLHSMRA